MAAHRCMVCNRIVMPGEWVCDACEDAYGLAGPFREWPETRALDKLRPKFAGAIRIILAKTPRF